jgi:hypothetical protein
MPRQPKPSGNKELKTGNDFIEYAQSRGAVIRPDRRGGFTQIETKEGSTYVAPGTKPLDYRTRKNLRHWLRILGLLMLMLFVTLPVWMQPVKNVLWMLQH